MAHKRDKVSPEQAAKAETVRQQLIRDMMPHGARPYITQDQAYTLLAALEECDVQLQNVAELLREYASWDQWAESLLEQVCAAGVEARAAIAAAKGE